MIECRMQIRFEDPFCKACGAQGQARGTVSQTWSMCRWDGGPRSWWCACGVSPARTAAECGDRTPPPRLSPGPG